MLHFVEILRSGAEGTTPFALRTARSIHPHLSIPDSTASAGAEAANYNSANENDCKVIVAKDLEDLIPVFMRNRHKELDALRVALAAADFEQLAPARPSHERRGQLALHARLDARQVHRGRRAQRRPRRPAGSITEYGEYLSKVQITYE